MPNDAKVISTKELRGSFETVTANIQELVIAAEHLGVGIRIEMWPGDEPTWKVEALTRTSPEKRPGRKPKAEQSSPGGNSDVAPPRGVEPRLPG